MNIVMQISVDEAAEIVNRAMNNINQNNPRYGVRDILYKGMDAKGYHVFEGEQYYQSSGDACGVYQFKIGVFNAMSCARGMYKKLDNSLTKMLYECMINKYGTVYKKKFIKSHINYAIIKRNHEDVSQVDKLSIQKRVNAALKIAGMQIDELEDILSGKKFFDYKRDLHSIEEDEN